MPEWDGWCIPICPSWVIAPKTKTWVELVPIEAEKCFGFRVVDGGAGWNHAEEGTKQGPDVVCPPSLWEIFKRDGRHNNAQKSLPYSQLIENAGGLRRWEKRDFIPRSDDLLQERLYCIRWCKPDYEDDRGRIRRGELVYREPRIYDLDMETRVTKLLDGVFDEWQEAGWIPGWRIEPGYNTTQPMRERGWTHWNHLYNPRQLLMAGEYSRRITNCSPEMRAALTLAFGRVVEANARLTRWKPKDGGGIGGTVSVYYNQALNTMLNYASRSWKQLSYQAQPVHQAIATNRTNTVNPSLTPGRPFCPFSR